MSIIVFILAIILFVFSINKYIEDKDAFNVFSNSFKVIILFYLGITLFNSSFKSSKSLNQNQLDDKKELINLNELILLKSERLVNKLLGYLFWITEFIFIILWSNSKNEYQLVIVVIFGILIFLKFILEMGSLIYYYKKNKLM